MLIIAKTLLTALFLLAVTYCWSDWGDETTQP